MVVEKIKLDNLCDVRRGASPRPIGKYYCKEGIPWVKISDGTSAYKTIYKTETFIKESGKDKSVEVYRGDLILSNSGTPALPRIMGINACIHDGWLLLRNFKKVEKQYLYYYLLAYRKNIELLSTGTIYQNLNTDRIKSILIPIPTLNKQKLISNKLAILDKKIEQNLKIVSTIEEYIDVLFYKWFIDFNFPNKEKNPYKDNNGNLLEKKGKTIPENWDVEYLGKGKLSKLLSPGIEKYNGLKKYVTTSNVISLDIDNDLEETTFKDRTSRANMQPCLHSVWFAKMKNSIKHVFVLDQDIVDNHIFSTGFAGLQCSEKSFPYVASFINSNYFERKKDKLSNGSTQKAINNTGIKNIKIVVPTEEILEKYYEKAYPLFKKIDSLRKQNKILEETRDLMIKKLIK